MVMNMKQKIVLEVLMPCTKCKTRARKIAALTEGMTSMAIDEGKNQLVMVGDGMDVPILATKLRKKVGRTTIISIEEVKSEAKKKEEEAAKKKKEEEEAKKKKEQEAKKRKEEEDEAAKNRSVTWSYDHYNNYARRPPSYDVVHYGYPNHSSSWW